MKKILFIAICVQHFLVSASHIVGGDIYYDYLGNNNYRFTISVYRDCLSPGAAFDNPLYLAIYTGSGNLVQNVQVPFPGSAVLPVVFNNPCVTPPNNICTEIAVYITTVNLPPIPGGYDIAYQRCCRGPNITNLVNPDDTGFTLTCHIPGLDTGAWQNSSPRFTNYPPLLLCNNDDLIFDHSATDPDGDQLVYSLVTPNAGANSLNPQPIPAPPPVYPLVVWAGGFSAANPLGPGASINIDPVTGLLTASPNLTGLFVVGIRVQEIRNGVVINSLTRDFLFRVFNCNIQMQAILPDQEDLASFVSYCQGLTVQFENDSYGGSSYSWDFGVPGTNADVSNAFTPTYTYPAPGTYNATLVVNPGWPCTDTAYMEIIVNNELEVSFTSQDSLCIFGNSFDFVATSTGPPNVVYTWDFGPNGNPTTAIGQTVNASFSATGNIPVTVEASIPNCEASFSDTIYIFPEPIAAMVIPPQVECLGLEIDFGNTSQNSVLYAWDFGVQGTNSDVSALSSPTYTFPGPGTYTVTLVAGSTPQCLDTITADIELNLPIIIDFTTQDSMCITGNSFDFDATVSGPPATVYTWNFGPNASISSSNEVDVNGVSFTQPGDTWITFSGVHENCAESITQSIYLYSEPTIGFTLLPGLQCLPFEAYFIDQSWAETSIDYLWDFGDGSTSTEQNPVHLYTELGTSPVTLTISTSSGCISTLTLFQSDLINVRPNPTAGFELSKEITDICQSTIEFYDESDGASAYYYWFDDISGFSTEQNPTHLYLLDGMHYPMQTVVNEWGCKDSATLTLFIEPFVLYVPNTFTPDEDEFNTKFLGVSAFDVLEWNMKIFNRWGELIFETEDFDQGWDGTNALGQYVQDGLYVYVIDMKTCEPINSDKFLTGHVNLLR